MTAQDPEYQREMRGSLATVLRGARSALRQLRAIPVGHQSVVMNTIVYRVAADQFTTVPSGCEPEVMNGPACAVELQQVLQGEMEAIDQEIF